MQASEASGYKTSGADRDSEEDPQQLRDVERQNVQWVKDLSSETEPWVKGLYLNEVSMGLNSDATCYFRISPSPDVLPHIPSFKSR